MKKEVGERMSGTIMDFELAEDVQEFISSNLEVEYSDIALKTLIIESNPNELLKVVKTIDSPTKFISVEVVNDAFLDKSL